MMTGGDIVILSKYQKKRNSKMKKVKLIPPPPAVTTPTTVKLKENSSEVKKTDGQKGKDPNLQEKVDDSNAAHSSLSADAAEFVPLNVNKIKTSFAVTSTTTTNTTVGLVAILHPIPPHHVQGAIPQSTRGAIPQPVVRSGIPKPVGGISQSGVRGAGLNISEVPRYLTSCFPFVNAHPNFGGNIQSQVPPTFQVVHRPIPGNHHIRFPSWQSSVRSGLGVCPSPQPIATHVPPPRYGPPPTHVPPHSLTAHGAQHNLHNSNMFIGSQSASISGQVLLPPQQQAQSSWMLPAPIFIPQESPHSQGLYTPVNKMMAPVSVTSNSISHYSAQPLPDVSANKDLYAQNRLSISHYGRPLKAEPCTTQTKSKGVTYSSTSLPNKKKSTQDKGCQMERSHSPVLITRSSQTDLPIGIRNQSLLDYPHKLYRAAQLRLQDRNNNEDWDGNDSDSGYNSPQHRQNLITTGTQVSPTQSALERLPITTSHSTNSVWLTRLSGQAECSDPVIEEPWLEEEWNIQNNVKQNQDWAISQPNAIHPQQWNIQSVDSQNQEDSEVVRDFSGGEDIALKKKRRRKRGDRDATRSPARLLGSGSRLLSRSTSSISSTGTRPEDDDEKIDLHSWTDFPPMSSRPSSHIKPVPSKNNKDTPMTIERSAHGPPWTVKHSDEENDRSGRSRSSSGDASYKSSSGHSSSAHPDSTLGKSSSSLKSKIAPEVGAELSKLISASSTVPLGSHIFSIKKDNCQSTASYRQKSSKSYNIKNNTLDTSNILPQNPNCHSFLSSSLIDSTVTITNSTEQVLKKFVGQPTKIKTLCSSNNLPDFEQSYGLGSERVVPENASASLPSSKKCESDINNVDLINTNLCNSTSNCDKTCVIDLCTCIKCHNNNLLDKHSTSGDQEGFIEVKRTGPWRGRNRGKAKKEAKLLAAQQASMLAGSCDSSAVQKSASSETTSAPLTSQSASSDAPSDPLLSKCKHSPILTSWSSVLMSNTSKEPQLFSTKQCSVTPESTTDNSSLTLDSSCSGLSTNPALPLRSCLGNNQTEFRVYPVTSGQSMQRSVVPAQLCPGPSKPHNTSNKADKNVPNLFSHSYINDFPSLLPIRDTGSSQTDTSTPAHLSTSQVDTPTPGNPPIYDEFLNIPPFNAFPTGLPVSQLKSPEGVPVEKLELFVNQEGEFEYRMQNPAKKRRRRRRNKTYGDVEQELGKVSDSSASREKASSRVRDSLTGLERTISSSNVSEMTLHFEDADEFPDLLASSSRRSTLCEDGTPCMTSVSYSDALKFAASNGRQSRTLSPASHEGGRSATQSPASHGGRRSATQSPGSRGGRRSATQSPGSRGGRQSDTQSLTGGSDLTDEGNLSCGTTQTEGESKRARKRRKRREKANQEAEAELAEISLEQQWLKSGLGARPLKGLITEQSVIAEIKRQPGMKSQQPISIDIAAMLDSLHKSPVDPSTSSKASKSPAQRRKSVSPASSVNQQDSATSLQKRGKEREVPKAKKPSPLKKVILKEREARKKMRLLGEEPTDPPPSCLSNVSSSGVGIVMGESEQSQDDLSSDDAEKGSAQHSADLSPISQTSPIPMSPASPGTSALNSPISGLATVIMRIHSRRFREYCNQTLDKEIDACCTALLQDLVKFQDRMYHKDPVKAKNKRRLVLGLREVTKHLKLKRIKCVVISPNLEKIQSKGGLDETLNNIISICQEQGVPFVFALGRRALGRACAKLVPVSVVGVFNYDGSESNYHKLISLTEAARAAYNEMVKAVEREAAELPSFGCGGSQASSVSGVPGIYAAHLGHSRTPSGCSAISFTSSILSEPISENYPHAEPEVDSKGYEIVRDAAGNVILPQEIDDGNEADIEDCGEVRRKKKGNRNTVRFGENQDVENMTLRVQREGKNDHRLASLTNTDHLSGGNSVHLSEDEETEDDMLNTSGGSTLIRNVSELTLSTDDRLDCESIVKESDSVCSTSTVTSRRKVDMSDRVCWDTSDTVCRQDDSSWQPVSHIDSIHNMTYNLQTEILSHQSSNTHPVTSDLHPVTSDLYPVTSAAMVASKLGCDSMKRQSIRNRIDEGIQEEEEDEKIEEGSLRRRHQRVLDKERIEHWLEAQSNTIEDF